MADLPIASDEGAQPVVVNDATTTANTLKINSDGSSNARVSDTSGNSVTVGQKTMANSLPVVVASDQTAILVSPGNTTGKTNVLKTGNLVTTATTVDQVVLTYTVTSGKTFFVEYLTLWGTQTTPAGGTSIVLGTISLETPSGTKVLSERFIGGGAVSSDRLVLPFTEPIPVASAVVIRVVVTPSSTTSMTWFANFGGYER